MSIRRDELTTALRQRVYSGLHLGLLRHGDRLPSGRDVAREFSVDRRVVIGAYQTLERQGVVELRQRSGIYVAAPAEPATVVPNDRADWLIEFLAEGVGFGIPAVELAERVRRSLETLRLRALVLECNDDQLYSVSDELRRDYGLDVDAVDLTTLGSRAHVTHDDWERALSTVARRADCVVTTAPHARTATDCARVLGVPVIVVTMCDDLFAEVGRLLNDRPVYFVVTDRRFERRLRGVFRAHSRRLNLRVLVRGRDDLTTIPPDAPAYLTRLTRSTLDPIPLLTRVLPEARVFSDRSAREILQFVVRSNLAVLRDGARDRAVPLQKPDHMRASIR